MRLDTSLSSQQPLRPVSFSELGLYRMNRIVKTVETPAMPYAGSLKRSYECTNLYFFGEKFFNREKKEKEVVMSEGKVVIVKA